MLHGMPGDVTAITPGSVGPSARRLGQPKPRIAAAMRTLAAAERPSRSVRRNAGTPDCWVRPEVLATFAYIPDAAQPAQRSARMWITGPPGGRTLYCG